MDSTLMGIHRNQLGQDLGTQLCLKTITTRLTRTTIDSMQVLCPPQIRTLITFKVKMFMVTAMTLWMLPLIMHQVIIIHDLRFLLRPSISRYLHLFMQQMMELIQDIIEMVLVTSLETSINKLKIKTECVIYLCQIIIKITPKHQFKKDLSLFLLLMKHKILLTQLKLALQEKHLELSILETNQEQLEG